MPDRRRFARAWMTELTRNRSVLTLLGVGAVLLAVAVAASIASLNTLTANNQEVEHTLRVQSSLNRLVSYNERIETARRGFLIAPDASFIDIVRGAMGDFARELEETDRLVADNPRQVARVEEIKRLTGEREPIISDTLLTPATIAAQARETGLNKERGVQITRRIREVTRQMLEAEDNLLFARNRAQIASQTRFYLISGTATLLLLATLLAVIVLVLRFNRDLNKAQVRLREANEGLEQAVAARTSELTRANQEIQRFAYIVSHDLRSPLVNVLGFTAELDEARKLIRKFLDELFEQHPELRNQAVWLAADEDLPEALDFIRKSTEKMDRLINSILELSRQGRRPLSPELLDMNQVADGVAASLYQRAEVAGAEVVVEPIPPLQSDRIAVEQILSNLVENALKYLSPKRAGRVEVSGRKVGRMIEIAVKDNGRGIDPADHARVFELFRRAGTQDQPGEGIGLANVRALAYRLGGTVEVDSQLDEGATFTLSLPEHFVAVETIA
jgi:signal transduction histidine kinase